MDSTMNHSYRIDTSNRRLRNSCDFCTQSKLKCDQTKPSCNRCIRRRRDCIYSQVRKAGRPPKIQNKHWSRKWEVLSDQGGTDFSLCTPSPHDSAFGSIDCPMDTNATFPDSRTPSPSADGTMEGKVMGCFDNLAWDLDSFASFPPEQDWGWLHTYDSSITNSLGEANSIIEDLLDVNGNKPIDVPDLGPGPLVSDQETHGQPAYQPVQTIDTSSETLQDLEVSCLTNSLEANQSGRAEPETMTQIELLLSEQSPGRSETIPEESQGCQTISTSISDPEGSPEALDFSQCQCISLITKLQESMYHYTQAPGQASLVPLDLLLYFEEAINQAQETFRNCKHCRPRSSHLMVMLCAVIDWVADSFGKTLSQGISSRAGPSSQERLKSTLQIGSSVLEDDVSNLCVYQLLKSRLRRVMRTVEWLGGTARRRPGGELACVESACMMKAMRVMEQDLRAKLEYLVGLLELWAS